MKTIWKFPLAITDQQLIPMPKGAKLLSVQVQGGVPCVWASVDPEQPKEPFTIHTFGTGHQIENDLAFDRLAFLGTYQLRGGALVFHVFYKE